MKTCTYQLDILANIVQKIHTIFKYPYVYFVLICHCHIFEGIDNIPKLSWGNWNSSLSQLILLTIFWYLFAEEIKQLNWAVKNSWTLLNSAIEWQRFQCPAAQKPNNHTMQLSLASFRNLAFYFTLKFGSEAWVSVFMNSNGKIMCVKISVYIVCLPAM